MRKTYFRFLAASCLLGFLPATAEAQLGQPEQPNQAAEPQPGEPLGQQTTPRPQSPNTEQNETDESYESRRVDPSASARQGQKGVQDFLVMKLMLGNKAEVELSQLAIEKTQNQEIRQYAQKMVQDHQQMNEKLQQLKSDQPASRRAGRTDRAESPDGARRGAERNQQADQPDQEPNIRQQTPSQERPRLSQREQQARARAGDQRGQRVPQQLTQLTMQAAENHLRMAKQTLQQYEGQDFDMGFLGMQIVGHTQMLAGLQAMQGVGSLEFQQLVKQAEQTTTEHLDQAKQLAKKLEDDRRAASRGSEPDAQPLRRGGAQDSPTSN